MSFSVFLVVAQARGYLIVETAEYLYYRVSMWLYRLHVISHQLLRRINTPSVKTRLGGSTSTSHWQWHGGWPRVEREVYMIGPGDYFDSHRAKSSLQGSLPRNFWWSLRLSSPSYSCTMLLQPHRSRYRQRIQPPVLHSRRVESKQISQNCIIFPWLLYPSIESIRWLLFIGTKSLA